MCDTAKLLPVAYLTDMKALIIGSVIILIASIAKLGLEILFVFLGYADDLEYNTDY